MIEQPKEIKPGQLWVDRPRGDRKDCLWNRGYTGEMLYVICSKEPDSPWLAVCFQQWKMGAYQRVFNEKEIRTMEYVGHLIDFKA